jgi:flagellar motor protein MotB
MGEAISESMARQELELDQKLAGSDAHITNTGSQPLVILPENAAFPTGSDIVDPGFRPPAERDIASSDRAPQLNINASDIPALLAGKLPDRRDQPIPAGR